MSTNVLTFSKASSLLSYNPETGDLLWKRLTRRRAIEGCAVRSRDSNGYVRAWIDGRYHLGHRIAWMLHYGDWPSRLLDHVNGIRDDNRLCNLREASHLENAQNIFSAPTANQSSGLLGVTWNRKAGHWQAQIKLSGKSFYLGLFQDKWQAHKAYLEAKKSIHPFETLSLRAA